MKKLFLTLLISLTLISANFAQIPKEAFDLTNSLSGLWKNGEIDKAVESSIELYRLYPPMFIERIHNTLAQRIEDDSKQNSLKYLEQLYNENNQEINEIIAPILLWSKTINSKDESGLKSIAKELESLLGDSSNYESRTERYCLLIIKELDEYVSIDDKTKEELIIRNIKNIEAYPFLIDVPADRKEAEKRAWHRYILAYSYDYLYSNLYNEVENLKLASDYSPDLSDRLNEGAYFYDAALLSGNTKRFGFKSKYQKYLADANREVEALELLSEIAFGNPSNHNIELLQAYYMKTNGGEAFKSYWENYIHKNGKAVPNVKIKFENEEIDLSQKSDGWIYIDIWGTWCSPCRKELPELQTFYLANKEVENSKLKIYTFSYNSQKLSEFMTENKYTFPVSEIDKRTNNLFEVSGYPTKILITPNGNYIKIPFGVNWKMFVNNYTLMN